MVARRKENTDEGSENPAVARSLAISEAGVVTGQDFAGLMSALMSDVIAGRIDIGAANAAVNAGGKLLKVVEMQYKYGSKATEQPKPFRLIG